MKAIVGTVPLLPWWRLQGMTDEEVEKFNIKHLVEIEMSDIRGVNYCMNCEEVIPHNVDKHICKKAGYVDGWNAAIEAAAKLVLDYGPYNEDKAEQIRKLKK